MAGSEQVRLAHEFADDMTGYGPLQTLLIDDSVSDIMVNAPNKVYVERHGKIERVAIRFRDADHIAMVGQKIAARVGRRHRRIKPHGRCTRTRRQSREYRVSAAGDRQSLHLDPSVSFASL